MSPDVVVVPDTATIRTALRAFRQLDDVPDQIDQLFVVDQDQRLIGALPLKTTLVSRLRTPVTELMNPAVHRFRAHDDAQEAARAFERYDLVSAPVVDVRGLAMDQINTGNIRYLWFKEAAVTAINGLVWGSAMGLVAFALYMGFFIFLGLATVFLLH